MVNLVQSIKDVNFKNSSLELFFISEIDSLALIGYNIDCSYCLEKMNILRRIKRPVRLISQKTEKP